MKRSIQSFVTISLATMTLFSLSSCHFDKKIAATELSSGYTRQNDGAPLVTDTFKSAMTDFSLNLFQKTLPDEKKNNLLSPLSAATCLALVNNGASGNTRAQLETLFGMQTNELNSALYAYTSTLYTGKNCEVNVANSIWFRENELNVLPSFLQTNADWYGAQAYAAPFNQETVQDINNWCYNHTKGKIDKIIDKIKPESMMYLINTLDFDANWAKEYERKDVEDGVFYNANGTTTDVKMLYSKQSIYLSDEYAVGFTRPYEGNMYSFVALLPNEGVDVYDYAKSLTGEKWQAFFEEPQYRDIHARIPEFSYSAEFSLKSTLQALGVTDMFSKDADFSQIGTTQEGYALFCEDVKQKSIISLDRNGTKITTITLAGFGAMSAGPAEEVYITLDRPFLYAVVDNTHDLPLFIGVVNNL